jgi:N-acetyl-gamma-glutamylphosphate reductase
MEVRKSNGRCLIARNSMEDPRNTSALDTEVIGSTIHRHPKPEYSQVLGRASGVERPTFRPVLTRTALGLLAKTSICFSVQMLY